MLALPPVGGLYFAGLTVVGQVGAIVGIPLLALGLASTWIAIRPSHEAEALRPAHSRA